MTPRAVANSKMLAQRQPCPKQYRGPAKASRYNTEKARWLYSRNVMRAFVVSYGDISIRTRSPMTSFINRLRILPEI